MQRYLPKENEQAMEQIDVMRTKLFNTEHTCSISLGIENDKLEEDVVNVTKLLREMQDMVR